MNGLQVRRKCDKMKFACIASGSSGNCIYVGTGLTHLLIDMGVSCKKIESGLTEFGIDPGEISGILVTHEHIDHVQGIGTFTKKYRVPIYSTIETFAALKKIPSGKAIPVELMMNIEGDASFSIGDIGVEVTEISHDAAHPVCYRFTDGTRTIAMATDLGLYDEKIIKHMSGSDVIYIESNYDPEMLLVGPYPYYLKQRIDGQRGHLSNEVSAELVSKVLHPGLKKIVLAHLSRENNFPEIAFQTHKNSLDENWNFGAAKPEIMVARRDVPSVNFEI